MTDRFDIEQEILHCWNVVEDIRLLNKYVLEGTPAGDVLTTDRIANYLLGIEAVYELKFQQLWDSFSKATKTNEI